MCTDGSYEFEILSFEILKYFKCEIVQVYTVLQVEYLVESVELIFQERIDCMTFTEQALHGILI